MDPNECITQLVEVFSEQNWKEFTIICDELSEHLAKGGFVPILNRVQLNILLSMASQNAERATQ